MGAGSPAPSIPSALGTSGPLKIAEPGNPCQMALPQVGVCVQRAAQAKTFKRTGPVTSCVTKLWAPMNAKVSMKRLCKHRQGVLSDAGSAPRRRLT